MYYSPAHNGFYSPEIHADMPEDCVEISDSEYYALLDGQSAGKLITAQDGKPALIDAPPPTAAEIKDVRIAELQKMLADTDFVATTDYDQPAEDTLAKRAAWRTEIRELQDGAT